MNKIKIAILVQGHWSDLMGGAQYQVKQLVEELLKKYSCNIFFITRNVATDYQPKNYKIIRLIHPKNHLSGSIVMACDVLSIPKILFKLRPDIIYQRVACWQTGIAALISPVIKSKFVWHISSDMDVDPSLDSQNSRSLFRIINRLLINFGIRNANTIVAQTNNQSNLLELHYGRKAGQIIGNFHPIPQGTIKKEVRPLTIVWISNIKPLKRPEIFIKISKEFKQFDYVKFIMIGKLQGPSIWEDNIRLEIIKSRNLKYLGYKSQEEVNKILEQSHILINTSEYEGFPNTFIQAWMREVPVLSLSVDPDNVLNREKLGYCATGSYPSLINYLEILIKNGLIRKEIGKRAREYSYKKHSLKNTQKFVDIFNISS